MSRLLKFTISLPLPFLLWRISTELPNISDSSLSNDEVFGSGALVFLEVFFLLLDTSATKASHCLTDRDSLITLCKAIADHRLMLKVSGHAPFQFFPLQEGPELLC